MRTYLRTATGPVFRPLAAPTRDELQGLAQANGFSLHAGVAAQAGERAIR
jgi:hypothetical protein